MRRRLSLWLLVVLVVLTQLTGPATAQQGVPETLAGIDEYVEHLMGEWKLPGLAIAVTRDGEVILAEGYGYRDVARQLPVTADTLFAIGSNSKSFTAAVLGTLVAEGKLTWDEPVRTYLPDFRLQDPVATEQMTARDLVSHRSGLPRHDLVWYGSDLTRRELFERLRYLEPSRPFRAVWQYQNLMFMTAGYLAGQVAGSTWEQLVRERLFEPLDMTRSNFSVTVSQADDDHALPYEERNDEVVAIPFRNIDEVGPAGSINSSVAEMIRYVQMHIEEGRAGDTEVLAGGVSRLMQTPQMVIPPGPVEYEEVGHQSYGLGLMVTTYQGKRLVRHGGGIDGFISQMSWMPSEKTGIVVLTNFGGNNPVPNILSYYVYDRLLGLEPVDWVSRWREQEARGEERAAERRQEIAAQRRDRTSPTHDLAEYAGSYEHPAYGRIAVQLVEGALRLAYRELTANLRHYHYDVFQPEEGGVPPAQANLLITFLYDTAGRIDRVAVPFQEGVGDIVFQRIVEGS